MVSDDAEELKGGATSIRANFTSYPAIERIMVKIATLITRKNASSEGPVLALVGRTRSGKSHLLRILMSEHAVEPIKVTEPNGDFAYQTPVVYVKFVGKNTKALTEAVYKAITGRRPQTVLGTRCTESEIMDEIIRHRRECGIRLLILDEAHQSILNKTDHAAKEIAKLVKDLSNARFSVLIVGTEELRRLIHADEELEGRSPKILAIHPLKRQSDDMSTWVDILDDIDAVLRDKVFGRLSELSEPALAEALMTASGGTVGHMATLVENAATEAIDQWNLRRAAGSGNADPGPHAIGWNHLEIAFSEWAPGHSMTNPFHSMTRPPAGGSPIPALADAVVEAGPETGLAEPGKVSNVRGTTVRGARANRFKT